MTTDRVSAWSWEGVGLVIPPRNPAHADPNWFQTDADDQIEDPDAPFIDPLPTQRHREVPDDLPTWTP